MTKFYSTHAVDPSAARHAPVSANLKGGRVRSMTILHALVGATVAAGDELVFCSLPSNARILGDNSFLRYDATAGGTEVDIGFDNDIDACWDGQSIASAGVRILQHATATAAKRSGKVWELAGLAADPGGELDLKATFVSEITGNGAISLSLQYVLDS